jgi:hypothetical protein
MLLSESTVFDFKTKYCNENHIIPILLKEHTAALIQDPILDVGSGLGEVSSYAFADKIVIHLDILDYKTHPLPASHRRYKKDFFDYTPENKEMIGTILFCHTLQYLDGSIDTLNAQIKSLNPKHIVTVTNTNQDLLGQLVSWSKKQCPEANPEVQLSDFPKGYRTIYRLPFSTTISCPDFILLAKQIGYLMEVSFSQKQTVELIQLLKSSLPTSRLEFKQEITVYEKTES